MVMRRIPTRAFTLIELLLVIAVIAVVVGITLPVLGGARRNARQTTSLNNIRGLMVQLEAYCASFKDAYPFMRAGQLVPTGRGLSMSSSNHWDAEYLWPGLVLAELSEPGPVPESLMSPSLSREYDGRASYRYSHGFLARPAAWASTGGPTSMDWIEAVRLGDVRTPSRKVVLHDGDVAYARKPIKVRGVDVAEPSAVAFADNHGDVRVPADATEPVINRLWSASEPRANMRLHNTAGGAAGIDY
jgi:prepilin-type N-terminal cleavage/methylation domain-containing protein